MTPVEKFRLSQKKGGKYWGAKHKKPMQDLEGDIKHFGRNNPYIGPEDNLQESVATILDIRPETSDGWTHVANEGERHFKVGAKNKRKGLKKGVPDCLVFISTEKYNGLAIELKSQSAKGNKGRLSKEQKNWLLILEKQGWFSCVCWSLDAVEMVLSEYFNT